MSWLASKIAAFYIMKNFQISTHHAQDMLLYLNGLGLENIIRRVLGTRSDPCPETNGQDSINM
jgi:hypothetical protein